MIKRRLHFATRSLRNKLLVGLALIHLLTIGSVVWYFYASYNTLMETIKDDQLQSLASAYASNNQIPTLAVSENASPNKKEGYIVQIWDRRGELKASSWPKMAIPLQPKPGLYTLHMGTQNERLWRVYSLRGGANSEIGTVQVIHSIDYMRQLIVRRALSAIVPLVLLFPLSFGVLWWVVWRVSRNLKNVSQLIASQDIHSASPLPVQSVPEEISPIVEAYNSVLERLRKAIESQRHFLQDSAHELRTPITAISLQMENLRQHIAPGAASERFTQLEAGVVRARGLVGQLLSLTRQQGIEPKDGHVEPVDIRYMLKESIEHLMVLADSRRIDVGFSGEGDFTLEANRSALRSLFDNLIGNAMRHTPPGSIVDVILKSQGSGTTVEIRDNGPGIPEEEIHRAFDRFSRFSTSDTPGSGLGLAIVKSIAARYGLKVELANCYSGSRIVGLCARVTL